MVATTDGFLVPSLRFATASVLCDGELDQRVPVSSKRLNLYCNPADGDEPYAVGFMPYLDARGLRRRLPHRELCSMCWTRRSSSEHWFVSFDREGISLSQSPIGRLASWRVAHRRSPAPSYGTG